MSALKSVARKMIYPSLVALGLERLLFNGAKRKRIVLCYHGVTPEPDFSINGRHISNQQFGQHLAYFKKHFQVVPVESFFEQKHKPSSKPQLAITFDDGFTNNYTQALPLLEKFGLPAAFFVTTRCLEDREFITWADMIEIITRYAPTDALIFGDQLFRRTASGKGWENVKNSQSLNDTIKGMGDERNALLQELAEAHNYTELKKKANADYYNMLDAETLKKFAASPLVTIGSHTHRHYNLSQIPEALVISELQHSRQLLETTIGKKIDIIAYPDGSYNDRVKQLSLEAGYDKQLAVSYQCASDAADPHILARHTISNTTTFESNLIGISRAMNNRGF